jgi:hypothetical protein
MIGVYYAGNFYKIEQEPFETINDSYKRAWYIVKNYGKCAYDKLYSNKLYSMSIMMLNKERGMEYELDDMV